MSVVAPPPLPRRDHARLTRALLLAGGAGLVGAALVYNEWLLVRLDPSPPLRPETVAAVRWIAGGFLAAGLALLGAAAAVGRHPALRRAIAGPWPARLLALLFVLAPLIVAEVALRPFTPLGRPMTTIFRRDPDLGWRMRPNAEGRWGDVTVRVNGQGLRGPERSFAKPPGERRILFLGDSVTFGYRLADPADAYPQRVAARLAADVPGLVAINAGVGGYSPWQERRFLETEGIRYDPDVVVLGLVLNDVTEKFGLQRFGGTGEGFQLEHSVLGLLDRLSVHSAVFYHLRALGRRRRFGADVRAGAERRELLDVRALVDAPRRDDVVRAWAATLDNVGAIARFCRERDVPFLLVVFPYAFQLAGPAGPAAPQEHLAAFAAAAGIPVVDLLPPLAARLASAGRTPDAYFVDRNHLTAEGADAVAAILAAEIRARGWLSAPGGR